MNPDSASYYEAHAADYFTQTVNADMSRLYPCFLDSIPQNGSILDAGCGSGRDLLAFSQRGYDAFGIDASQALVEMAKRHSGAPCAVQKLEEMDFDNRFNGVWACASLLHLERQTLPKALKNIHKALVSNGTLFATVQEGKGSKNIEDGRFYTFYNLEEFISNIVNAGFVITKTWKSRDVLPGRSQLTWINVLATKP